MVSRLCTSDFNKRVRDNTKIGNPKIKGTPFAGYVKIGDFNKPFFGDFKDSKFRLTKNSSLFPIPYIIQGFIKSKSDSETEVSIEIIPIGFGFYWIRLFPLALFILFNVIYFCQDYKLDFNVFFLINLFILLMFSPILIVNQMKKRFVKKFNRIFEIIE
jgi:hypothetical protein